MKVKGFLALLLFAALLLSGFGCGGGGALSAEQIRDEAIAAGAEMATCRFEMDMTMDMRVAMEGVTAEFTLTGDAEGAIDEPSEEMYMDMDMVMEMPLEEDEEMSMEMYVVEDWMYMGMDMGVPGEPTMWTKSPVAVGDWEQWDIASKQVDLLVDVELELVGSETLDGTECYVLEVTADLEKLGALIQLLGAAEGLPPEIDLEELITDFSVRQWIAKDTYFTRRATVNLTMVFTPESLGMPPELPGEFQATADMAGTISMHHINEPVTIELPPEAADAVEVPMS